MLWAFPLLLSTKIPLLKSTRHVSYDLKGGSPDDYQELYQTLNEYDDSKRALESSWLIETTKDCVTIRDELRAKMKTRDFIIVVPYGTQRASWLPSSVVDWINAKMHRE